MSENANHMRDQMLADELNRLEVPDHGSDFWAGLNARLQAEAPAVAERAASSRQNEVEAPSRPGSDGRPAAARTASPVDLSERRARRSGRGGWLAAAAAAALVMAGSAGYALQTRDANPTVADTATDADDNVTTAETPAPDGDDSGTVDNGETSAPVIEGSILDGVRKAVEYRDALDIELVGAGTPVAAAPSGSSVVITRTDPGTVGQGCEGIDPLRVVEVMAFDGSVAPAGLQPGVERKLVTGPNGEVAVVGWCEGMVLQSVGTMAPDGVMTTQRLLPDQYGIDRVLAGDPVWNDDGTVTVTRPSEYGFENTTFDIDGNELKTVPAEGVLLAVTADGELVERVGTSVTIGGVEVLSDVSQMVITGATTDPTGEMLAVWGDQGVTVFDPDHPEGRTVYDDAPVVQARFSPLGDLMFIVGYDPGRLFVADTGTGSGQAEALDILVETKDAVWAEGGRALIVGGSYSTDEEQVWLIRFLPGDQVPARVDGDGSSSVDDDVPTDDDPEPATDTDADNQTNDPDDATTASPSGGTLLKGSGNQTVTYVAGDGTMTTLVEMYPADGINNMPIGVVQLDGVDQVVYEHIEFVVGEEPKGTTELILDDMNPDTPLRVLERRTMTGVDGSWIYTQGIRQVDDVLWIERAFNQGACYWIDVVDADGNPVDSSASPYPRPDVDLDQLSAELVDGDRSGLGTSCPSFSPILGS